MVVTVATEGRGAVCRAAVGRRSVRAVLWIVLGVVLSAAGLGAGAPAARAGTWTLVSCTQPDGQPAPTGGWRGGRWAGGAAPGSVAVDTCASGGSLEAVSSALSVSASDTGPEWVFTAPRASTIAGGTIEASLTARQGQSWIGTPLPAYDAADLIVACQLGTACGADGTLSGLFAIDHPGGDQIFAPAICVEASGAACPPVGTVDNAVVSIKAADIELTEGGRPAGSDFSGSLLSGRARGTATLSFTATDFNRSGGTGPGIYSVAVEIDGATVYSGVPDTKNGSCVALGTDPATGGLEFDHVQPCRPSARISVPVSTSALSDGPHALTVLVSDAAGNSRIVLTRTIRTYNPLVSPRPAPGQPATRLTLGWSFSGAQTTLASARAAGLPAHGRVAVSCRGRRCPRPSPDSVSTGSIARLWRSLEAVRWRAGDRLLVTITARHRKPEQIQYRIRRGRRPTQRLLSDSAAARR